MDTSCNIDSSRIYTSEELKQDYPGGFIYPIGQLPRSEESRVGK